MALSHQPTQASLPPDDLYTHYAWHATVMPMQSGQTSLSKDIHVMQQEKTRERPSTTTNTSDTTQHYLISGIPHNDILRLNLCTQKSSCILHRVTTLRASMQPVYIYCHHQGISTETTYDTTAQETLLGVLCAPVPEKHNRRLILAALGLSLFERNHL